MTEPDVTLTVTDLQVHRLLAAIFPTRFEKAMGRVVTWAYGRNEHGVYGFVGDRADDVRCASYRVRAWRKNR